MPAFMAAQKVLSPGFFEQPPACQLRRPGNPEKPYKQRSLLTKQRTRLTRLRTRILRKTPLFFFDQYPQKLAENPEYCGVCIIDDICLINPGQRLGWNAQEQAVARANKLRAQGW